MNWNVSENQDNDWRASVAGWSNLPIFLVGKAGTHTELRQMRVVTMTFRRSLVRTHYCIHGSQLQHVPEMRHHSSVLDIRLTFAVHISIVSWINRSLTLGLMVRSSRTGGFRMWLSRRGVGTRREVGSSTATPAHARLVERGGQSLALAGN